MKNGHEISRLPTLTDRASRIKGEIKTRPEDFNVEEIPLYETNGEGPHLYLKMTKQKITTDQAIRIVGEHFNKSSREIGVAGKKDKEALTTQRISLEHIDPEQAQSFNHPKIKLNVIDHHRNKLRYGHLEGNYFEIKIRGIPNDLSESDLRRPISQLEEKGVPNYFGSQRFGRRNDTALLGKLMVHDQLDEFVQQYFGRPCESDPDQCRQARKFFEDGKLEKAIDTWPVSYVNKRKALAAYIDRGKPGPVLSAIDKSRRQLFVSAYQSQFFNELLAKRMDDIDRLMTGDIARKTDTGGLFEVEDKEVEQPRADRFEISPTGLLPGLDPWYASGAPGTRERTHLEEHDLSEEDFQKVGYLSADGTRRPYRFRLEEADWQLDQDQHGEFLGLKFTIPSGCYATVFLREIILPQNS